MTSVTAIVVSAGVGQRLGQDKIFLDLAGRPVIAWSISVLQQNKSVTEIIVVLHKTVLDAGRKLVSQNRWSKVHAVCEGGELRQDSVRNGLSAVSGCDLVLIHDGARPFLTEALIEDGVQAAAPTGAAAASVEVKDTIKQVDESGIVTQTLHRGRLRAVQTPQVFRLNLIKKAYELLSGEFTDDAAIVERAGYKVKLYAGDYNNIKITTPDDLALAEILARRK